MNTLKNGSMASGVLEQEGEELFLRTNDNRLYRVPRGYDKPRRGRMIARKLEAGDSLCVPLVGINNDKPFWPHLEHVKET